MCYGSSFKTSSKAELRQMQLSDSIGSLDDPAPSLPAPSGGAIASGPNILDSFGDLDLELEKLPPPRPWSGREVHQPDPARVADRRMPLPESQPLKHQSKCGRKKGSTAESIELKRLLANPSGRPAPASSGPPRSRQDICRAAGQARQRKRKETSTDKLLPRPSPSSSSNCELAPSQALVPWSSLHQGEQIALFNNVAAQQQMVNWQPQRPLRKKELKQGIKTEAGILQSGLTMMSKTQLAKKLSVSRSTITRRLRLLAVCTLLVRKLRTEKRFAELYQMLRIMNAGCEVSVEQMLFIVKYKYDEMAMRLNALVNGKTETSVTKILQIQLFWTALWKIEDQYVRYRAQLPTCVTTVESAKTGTFRKAMESHVLFPECASGFTRKTRLPICDKHSTNTAVDYTFARDFADEKLHKFNCMAHVEQRVADGVCIVYPNEKKGLLHSGLAINYAGALGKIKSSLKKANRANFTWIDSATGPGEEADRHREAVFAHCCQPREDDHREVSTEKLVMFHRRAALWNGRYSRFGKTEHWCKSRACCRDAEHCLTKMDAAIDDEAGPGDWCPSRFMRIEDTVDWELYWQSNGGLLEIAIDDAWGDSVKSKPEDKSHISAADAFFLDGGPLEAIEDDEAHEWHLPEDDIGLAEPVKDETHLQRQSTFRSNTVIWVRSKPLGRLWCFKSTIRCQQAAQRYLVKHAGPKWMAKELRRRQEGKRPTYRVVMAAKGDFHKPAMQAWSELMKSEDAWDGLPRHFRRHDLSIHAYRGLATALCTKYQLEVVVLEGHPCKGYLVLDDEELGTAEFAAMELQEEFEQNPCLFDPQWFAHCDEFPTAEKLRSPDSLAIISCRADEVELDNWGVEVHNANLYRTIKRAVQQKLAKVEDVSAGWVLRCDRLIHTYLWGDLEYPADYVNTGIAAVCKGMRGGGGGICRAFVSLLAPDHVREDGRTDFAVIMQKFKEEKAKPVSEVLESLKENGLEATQARREQVAQGKRWHMSAFGKVRPQALRADARQAEMKSIMDAVKASSSPAETRDAAAGQIVPVTRDPSLSGSIVAVAGAELPNQLALLRKVGRQTATEDRKRQEQVEKEVHEGLRTSKPLLGRELPVAESSRPNLRTLATDQFYDVFFHEDVCSDVMKKVKLMSKTAPMVVKACETLWRRDHNMVTDAESPEVGPIPASAKPTFCHLYGGGLCLCKGRGLLARLMATNLAQAVCSRAPKDSELRKLLKTAFIVIHLGPTSYAARAPRMLIKGLLRGACLSSRRCLSKLASVSSFCASGAATRETSPPKQTSIPWISRVSMVDFCPCCAIARPATRWAVAARGFTIFPAASTHILTPGSATRSSVATPRCQTTLRSKWRRYLSHCLSGDAQTEL